MDNGVSNLKQKILLYIFIVILFKRKKKRKRFLDESMKYICLLLNQIKVRVEQLN